jgi:hypothetical protein
MPPIAPQMVYHHVLAVSYTLYLTEAVLCITPTTAVRYYSKNECQLLFHILNYSNGKSS